MLITLYRVGVNYDRSTLVELRNHFEYRVENKFRNHFWESFLWKYNIWEIPFILGNTKFLVFIRLSGVFNLYILYGYTKHWQLMVERIWLTYLYNFTYLKYRFFPRKFQDKNSRTTVTRHKFRYRNFGTKIPGQFLQD